MKLLKNILFPIAIAAFSLAIISCEEEFLLPSPEKVENTQLFADVFGEFFNIWKRVDEALRNPTVQAGGQITLDQATIAINGSVLVIDFGNIQKLCEDGKTRRGRIEVTLSGIYGLQGSAFQISFVSYRVNNNPLNGNISISTQLTNQAFSVSSTNFSFRDLNISIGSNIFWESGFLTTAPNDDTLKISLSGSSSRMSIPYSISFNTESNNELFVAMECKFKIMSGVISQKHHIDSSEVILDFIASDGCNDVVGVNFVNERYHTFIKFSGF